jgi:hypothetical protein
MDGAHIQVCHPVRMFPVITDVAHPIGTDGKHDYTEAVFSVFFVICRVFRHLPCMPCFSYKCRVFVRISLS